MQTRGSEGPPQVTTGGGTTFTGGFGVGDFGGGVFPGCLVPLFGGVGGFGVGVVPLATLTIWVCLFRTLAICTARVRVRRSCLLREASWARPMERVRRG
ncbi:MAG: hypothetical protein QM758_10820 [Armatimonas sp.]